jgi:hypothetical protein
MANLKMCGKENVELLKTLHVAFLHYIQASIKGAGQKKNLQLIGNH